MPFARELALPRPQPAAKRPAAVRVPAPPAAVVSAGLPAACACGGGCPRCTDTGGLAAAGPELGAVRVHPAAAEVTAAWHARAVTIGQDIFFRPGEFRPGTPEGDALIAHELAHTLQTRQDPATGSAAPSEEALEDNANALAEGSTSQILAAPAGAALRTPLDGETPEQETRRTAAIVKLRHALTWVQLWLRRGELWPNVEEARSDGSVFVPHVGETFSRADRDARVARVRAGLISVIRQLEAAAAPVGWYEAESQEPGGTLIATGLTQAWTDAYMFYVHWAAGQGRSHEEIMRELSYLENNPLPGRREPSVFRSGIGIGIYLIVDDPQNDPYTYRRLTGYEGWNSGGVIVEVWHDDVGYFYRAGGRKIYLPGRP